MSDADDDLDGLGRSSASAVPRAASTSVKGAVIREPASLRSSVDPASRSAEKSTIVLAGPSGVGKTLWLCGVEQACASNTLQSTWLELAYGPEMADLITVGYERDRARESLNATAGVRSYAFSIAATSIVSGNGSGPQKGRLLGITTCECLDGPGGALFFDDLTERSTLNDDKEGYRRRLLETGRAASSLVFLVNPVHRYEQANIAGNMTLLLAELGIPIEMSVEPEPPAAHWWTRLGSRLQRRQPAAPAAPVSDRVVSMRKLKAKHVMFVFNHIDQVCVHWQAEWRKIGDPRGQLSPLEIAQQYVRPLQLAQDVLGSRFLQKVHGFLREDATLAVAVCSAGGFMTNGDPFRGADGRVNVIDSIDPRAAEEYRRVFGIRETLMFAGFGITTPGVVEAVSLESLALPA